MEKIVKRCDRCGIVQHGEYNQSPTCRNTAACRRRAAKIAERIADGAVGLPPAEQDAARAAIMKRCS